MDAEPPTIAALLTPPAPGAIAVIGLAGPRTDAILGDILRRAAGGQGRRVGTAHQLSEDERDSSKLMGSAHPTEAPIMADRRPTFCQMMDGDEVLDDVVVVRIRRGEMLSAEINTHGGVRIAQRALLVLEREGAEIVSGAAFVEGCDPIDPIERAVDRALLISGSRRLTEWLLAQRSILPPFLRSVQSLSEVDRHAFMERSRVAIRLVEGIHVAIVGPPNAGKSTLANLLIGSDRIITSDRPGTTRDWVSETALICGWPVTLIDTAGIRETGCEIESEAIRRTGEQAVRADVTLIVLDGSESVAAQQEVLTRVRARITSDRPYCVALNKSDLLHAAGGVEGACRISALTGEGVESLETILAGILGFHFLETPLPTAFLADQLE